jgi:hypothetical protein
MTPVQMQGIFLFKSIEKKKEKNCDLETKKLKIRIYKANK